MYLSRVLVVHQTITNLNNECSYLSRVLVVYRTEVLEKTNVFMYRHVIR
jgi:hypothetical protein